MIDFTHSVLIVVVVAIVSALTKFLPFLIFRSDKQTPKFISYLSRVLPTAIIGMLVVYCLKGVSLVSSPFGLPELIAIIVVAGSYIWKRNTLISVGLGTVSYMLLVQFVFK